MCRVPAEQTLREIQVAAPLPLSGGVGRVEGRD